MAIMELDWEPVKTGKTDRFGRWDVLGTEYKDSSAKKVLALAALQCLR